MSNSIFNAFKSEKPTSVILGLGKQIVNVIKIFMIDSFTNTDGSSKEDSVWSAPTPQLGVTFGNKDGVITTRLNGMGYLKSEDLDPEEMANLGLVDVDGYACKDLGDGTFERVQHEGNTESCLNILNRFVWACGVPEGTSIEELMTLAKDNEIQLEIDVRANEWDGKTRNEVYSFNQVKAGAEVKGPDLA
jgi:hypothetical protein